MEKICKVPVVELYGDAPLSTVLSVGDEIYFLLTPNLEKSKLNFIKGKIIKPMDYGVTVERDGNNNKVISKIFVGKHCLFIEMRVMNKKK